MLAALKNRLLQAGPNSLVVFQAFRLQALMHGVWLKRGNETITLTKGRRRVQLSLRDAISVPFVVHLWNLFFDTVEGEERDGFCVLDFSRPALHHYKRTGLSFYSPSVAEDDCMDAYLDSYSPQPGDVIWDVGAYAGMTTYMFSQMVGPSGKVVAFEPDETNFEFLLRNIELHKLENVVPVRAALSDETGTATFCMDGTMSAGLTKTLAHSAPGISRMVQTLSPSDACERYGVPRYIKMDIEGAELSVIAACKSLLKEHPIHLVIESNHVVDGEFTAGPLEPLLAVLGYRVWSSSNFGQLFTWAEPPASAGALLQFDRKPAA